jgi:hypothetical protein
MGIRGRIALAAAAAAAVLTMTAGFAWARRFEVSSSTFRLTWSAVEFTTPLGAGARCPVTLEGSLHSRTITKTNGALVGYVTRAVANAAACEPQVVRFPAASLPWHVRYDSFSGALPAVRGVTFQVAAAVEINPCIWAASEAAPARFTYNLTGIEVTSVRWVEASTLSITEESPIMCAGSIAISGTGSAAVLGTTTRLRVRLI